MPRVEVEQRLLRRLPSVPAGVVLVAVGRAARRLRAAGAGGDARWKQVEQAAEEQLLLRLTLRRQQGGVISDPPTGSGEAAGTGAP